MNLKDFKNNLEESMGCIVIVLVMIIIIAFIYHINGNIDFFDGYAVEVYKSDQEDIEKIIGALKNGRNKNNTREHNHAKRRSYSKLCKAY